MCSFLLLFKSAVDSLTPKSDMAKAEWWQGSEASS